MTSLSLANYGPTSPLPDQSGVDNRSKKSQARQLLSCTKCRERKVKCDRTEPCRACCARGNPKECEFIVSEGNDYSAIQQSYEITKLRKENQRLKERLQVARLPHSDDEFDEELPTSRRGSRTGSKAFAARQRGFKTGDRIDNLYFGTPCLASMVSDLANLQIGTQSLTHPLPNAKDIYAVDVPMYPFHALSDYSTCAALLQLLPPRSELLECLDLFQHHAQSCSFPHTPEEMTKKEVERFLDDAERNAEASPDMLALIFATLATGLQMGQRDQAGDKWDAVATEVAKTKGKVFLAASMQCLRNASFMNTPTLLGIQTLVMMGPYLTNSGRFLDAWTLFGTTIRLAHSMGLHRNPKFLDPVPSLPECSVRQTLWWWMLHMDQQHSVTLGRPLGISGFGDCPPPQLLTTNPAMLRLSEFINHFTVLSRQILSSDGMMSARKIDEFTDKLLGLWDTMPHALQFNESWLRDATPLPEWPLEVMATTLFAKVQSLLILLNRQRVERTHGIASGEASPPLSATPIRSAPGFPTMVEHLHPSPLRGRELVINSSTQILNAFMFFYHRNPAVLICWTMGQQAFNSCMILLLDCWETENEQNEWLVERVYVVFRELEVSSVHTLAGLAVERISEWIDKLGRHREERDQQATMSRRSSAARQQYPQQPFAFDTLDMPEWSNDTIMGNTGMFLLEDSGLQSINNNVSAFHPIGWNMLDPNQISQPPTPIIPSPAVPFSQVSAAPFSQVPAAPFPMTPAPFMPAANNPYAVGLQPRMPTTSSSRRPLTARSSGGAPQSAFTAINEPDQMWIYPQPRGAQTGNAGPRGVHRSDNPPSRSQQRRSMR